MTKTMRSNSFKTLRELPAKLTVAALALTPGLVWAEEESTFGGADEKITGFLSNLTGLPDLASIAVVTIAIVFAVGAVGDDLPGDPSDPPPSGGEEITGKLRVENLQAFFDGIDQYAVFGEVTNCADPDGLTITFGGIFAGHTTTTGNDGYFYIVISHEEANGATVSATATCRPSLARRSPSASGASMREGWPRIPAT